MRNLTGSIPCASDGAEWRATTDDDEHYVYAVAF